MIMQKRHEHNITKSFQRHIDLREDYPVGEMMKLAFEYLPIDFKGEAILSVGKAIEMTLEGASGIVNAMPFNCMPGTVVSSLSKKVSEDLGGIPWLNISYEGLRDSGEDTRLEAFADQVRAQLAALGHPIVGDARYGRSRGGERLGLLARSLSFRHPTRDLDLTVEAPCPADWPWPP